MRVVAVIPAHHEATTVAAVVQAIRASNAVDAILVVNDGSTDATAAEALRGGAHVLTLSPNRGKGQAMLAGLQALHPPPDAVLFADADLLGFTPAHVRTLVEPVVAGRAVMTCGFRDYGGIYNELQRSLPMLTGERCVTWRVLGQVPAEFWRGFRVEAGINAVAAQCGPVESVILPGLSMRPKWVKGDAEKGVRDAATMLRDVLDALVEARGIRL